MYDRFGFMFLQHAEKKRMRLFLHTLLSANI